MGLALWSQHHAELFDAGANGPATAGLLFGLVKRETLNRRGCRIGSWPLPLHDHAVVANAFQKCR